jgi:hypothetical protein
VRHPARRLKFGGFSIREFQGRNGFLEADMNTTKGAHGKGTSSEAASPRRFPITWLLLILVLLLVLAALALPGRAQVSTAAVQSVGVPHIIRFHGTLTSTAVTDESAKARAGTVSITFALYKDQAGGPPLWVETQNVIVDSSGHYSAQLGSTRPEGLPADLFITGEARWLGTQVEGQVEQPRVLLLSVPYALKAADAETLGGLPPSAFLLASAPNSRTAASDATPTSGSASALPPATTVTGTGTANFIPLWTGASTIADSALFQSGSSPIAKFGLNTTIPSATLDVRGSSSFGGLLALPATGTATSTTGKNSQALQFVASAFNSSGTPAAVKETFRWQAEPVGNNTATPSATLNLLFGSGTTAPAETGLKVNGKGLFTFANGQTFPGTGTITGVTTAIGSGLSGGGTTGALNLALTNTCSAKQILRWNGSAWACSTAGNGTLTGITAGTDLTGGGTSGTVTLNLDTTKVPQLNGVNTFTQTQVVNAVNPFGGVLQASSPYQAITGTMTSNDLFTPAVLGSATATGAGTTIGVEGLSSTTSGYGVFGSNGSGGIGVRAENSSFFQPALSAENHGGGPAAGFNGDVQLTGKVTLYNNTGTVANGVPSIVAEAAFSSSGSGDNSYQTLFTPANDGIFRIIAFQECTSSSGGGTIFSIDFVWTLPSGGQGFGQDFGGSCNSLSYNSASVLAHVKGGTPLQFNYSGMDASFQTTILVEQLL